MWYGKYARYTRGRKAVRAWWRGEILQECDSHPCKYERRATTILAGNPKPTNPLFISCQNQKKKNTNLRCTFPFKKNKAANPRIPGPHFYLKYLYISIFHLCPFRPSCSSVSLSSFSFSSYCILPPCFCTCSSSYFCSTPLLPRPPSPPPLSTQID